MATNKHAQIRYLALDRCFSNFGRNYNYDDLIEACNEAIYNHSGIHESVKKRQVQYDIEYMKSEAGWSVEIEKYTIARKALFRYKNRDYSIKNAPINEMEANQLKEAILTLNRIKGLPQFQWVDEMMAKLESSFNADITNQKVLGFDQMPYLKGIDFISELYNKIIHKRVLQVNYKPFHENQITLTIHPYYLKQYNNRWFLFGLNEGDNLIKNLPLDRIQSFKEIDGDYINTEIDFDQHFEDVIGVTVKEKHSEIIKLKIDATLWPYIDTKPFHGSQKKIEITEKFTIISLDVKVNYELESKILQHGEKIQVLEPIDIRDHLIERINKMKKNYTLMCKYNAQND
jgi:predicted DNA-binding transcriptional regulator YafY